MEVGGKWEGLPYHAEAELNGEAPNYMSGIAARRTVGGVFFLMLSGPAFSEGMLNSNNSHQMKGSSRA